MSYGNYSLGQYYYNIPAIKYNNVQNNFSKYIIRMCCQEKNPRNEKLIFNQKLIFLMDRQANGSSITDLTEMAGIRLQISY